MLACFILGFLMFYLNIDEIIFDIPYYVFLYHIW